MPPSVPARYHWPNMPERGIPSLLITFDDEDHLEREHSTNLSDGRAFVDGSFEVRVGEKCEAILVHPQSGESIQLEAEVVGIEDESVELRFAATPYVRTRLEKFTGTSTREPLHQRVRSLNAGERRKLALHGDLNERVALERAFGNQVWDQLLLNPKLSVGEVVKMARNLTMPGPLLEIIVQNNSWIRVPQIRRALLVNNRLQKPQILRVLQFTPPAELKLAPTQTAYPPAVRSAAKQMLSRK